MNLRITFYIPSLLLNVFIIRVLGRIQSVDEMLEKCLWRVRSKLAQSQVFMLSWILVNAIEDLIIEALLGTL